MIHVLKSGESLKDYCKRVGISYFTITNRMYSKCMTLEEALQMDKRLKFKDGRRLSEVCDKSLYQTVYHIYRRGYSLEEAYERGKRIRRYRKCLKHNTTVQS